ncbi:MAG: DUF5414 family protein [Chlamydiae bacterium]|nr:DUF5414 family protein [Chlamydiota bacterium]
MLNELMIHNIEAILKRIFCQKITRSTIREVQNGFMACTKNDQELSRDLLETVLSGTLQGGFSSHPLSDNIKKIISEFTIPLRVAKEVFERGEFISMVTSDILKNEGEIAFVNRIKRVDGEEFSFISDPASTLHLLHHFTARLKEFEQNKDLLQAMKGDLIAIKEKLEALTR